MEDLNRMRRELLRKAGLATAMTASGMLAIDNDAGAQPRQKRPPRSPLNVRDFGASGDGKKDDTRAFERALAAAEGDGGNLITIPRGEYRITAPLDIPASVTLEGVSRAPTIRSEHRGSCLLALVEGGNAEGAPLITLHENATLAGLTVYYPEQRKTADPIPYPWTVRGDGDNCSLVDVLLVNPYQAVDFGTRAAGRHYVRGLYAQAIYRGLFVDKCFDVGRLSDVHFWPFWEVWQTPLKQFTEKEGIAFIIGRTDWEYVGNCFCIGYSVGFDFVRTKDGSANAVFTQSGSDVGPLAVRVQNVQDHAGIAFSNCQFMTGIEIKETNRGPVKLTSCGFWPINGADRHALLEGSGHTTFTACHFSDWARTIPGTPAVEARRGSVTINGCDFAAPGKAQVRIGPDVDAAIVMGNRLRGAEAIANEAGARAQIGLNAVASGA